MEQAIESQLLLQPRLIHMAIECDYTDAISALIQRGVNSNAKTPEGLTPLMLAAMYDRPHAIQILLMAPQTNVNARSHDGTTALMLAAEKGNPSCTQALLTAPTIDINAQDIACDTAIDRAQARFKRTKENRNQICITLIEEYQETQRHYIVSNALTTCRELLRAIITPHCSCYTKVKEKSE